MPGWTRQRRELWRPRVVVPKPDPCDDWTILGRGPSLAERTQEDVLPGSQVIAVNGAIYHHAIRCHWLAGLDEPEAWLDPKLPDPPWGSNPMPRCVTRRERKWQMFCTRTGAELWSFPGGNGGNAEIAALVGDARRTVAYAKWSILLAIAWARYGGAKRIRLLGVDMAGTTRAYGRGNSIAPELRWTKNEGPEFAKCLEACGKAGVWVERWQPENVT